MPDSVRQFCKRYPHVRLSIKQGNPMQICEMVITGEADFAIATEGITSFSDLAVLPCYQWNRSIVTPTNHPLTRLTRPITLKDIGQWPIVTYDFAFTGRSKINKAFEAANVEPNVVLTAIDTDVIKTYVRIGLGIGIIASMAFEPQHDHGLTLIDAAHLFQPSTTRIGIRRSAYLRGFAYHFIQLFAPHLTRAQVDQAMMAAHSTPPPAT